MPSDFVWREEKFGENGPKSQKWTVLHQLIFFFVRYILHRIAHKMHIWNPAKLACARRHLRFQSAIWILNINSYIHINTHVCKENSSCALKSSYWGTIILSSWDLDIPWSSSKYSVYELHGIYNNNSIRLVISEFLTWWYIGFIELIFI